MVTYRERNINDTDTDTDTDTGHGASPTLSRSGRTPLSDLECLFGACAAPCPEYGMRRQSHRGLGISFRHAPVEEASGVG